MSWLSPSVYRVTSAQHAKSLRLARGERQKTPTPSRTRKPKAKPKAMPGHSVHSFGLQFNRAIAWSKREMRGHISLAVFYTVVQPRVPSFVSGTCFHHLATDDGQAMAFAYFREPSTGPVFADWIEEHEPGFMRQWYAAEVLALLRASYIPIVRCHS